MAAPNKEVLKALRIKAGVVKRLVKETGSYEKEAEQMQQRLEKMRSEEKDEYDIRKYEELVKETLAVIPDCRNRLKAANDDLQQLVDQNKDNVEPEADELKAAKDALEMAVPVLQVSA